MAFKTFSAEKPMLSRETGTLCILLVANLELGTGSLTPMSANALVIVCDLNSSVTYQNFRLLTLEQRVSA